MLSKNKTIDYYGYISPDFMDHHSWTSLHRAAFNGDIEQIGNILITEPDNNAKRTNEYLGKDLPGYKVGKCTALHLALLNRHYEAAQILIQRKDCIGNVNAENNWGDSYLLLAAQLPNKEKALEFCKIFINLHANVNLTNHEMKTPLLLAVENHNFALASFLLNCGANPNAVDGLFGNSLLHKLAEFLSLTNDANTIKEINQIIKSLLKHRINTQIRNMEGATFVDLAIELRIEKKLEPDVRKQFTPWEQSSEEVISKAAKYFSRTMPLRPSLSKIQSPSLQDTALLVNLKKQRRKHAGKDYDCTVIANREEFATYLKLAKIRYDATKTPFQTHFIIQPRIEENTIHVANGQLSFDDKGNVTVFWIDSLGHKEPLEKMEKEEYTMVKNTKETNEAIGAIIHDFFPKANVYVVDRLLQNTSTGCHIFALYISEQLSIAASKGKNIPADLERIYNKHPIENNGLRIIPWEKCPAYTGVPRMIQSASAPLKRLEKKEIYEDTHDPINKRKQTYKDVMDASLKEKEGRLINLTYDTKRYKFGFYLSQEINSHDDNTVTQKQFYGFADIVNRVPIEALTQKMGIVLMEKQNINNTFVLYFPKKYFTIDEINNATETENNILVEGTADTLYTLLNKLYVTMSTDPKNFGRQGFLDKCAFLKSASHIVMKQLYLNSIIDYLTRQFQDSHTITNNKELKKIYHTFKSMDINSPLDDMKKMVNRFREVLKQMVSKEILIYKINLPETEKSLNELSTLFDEHNNLKILTANDHIFPDLKKTI